MVGPSHPNCIHCLKGLPQSQKSSEVLEKTKAKERSGFDKKAYLLCRVCFHRVTRKTDRIQINEKHEHTFANPHGYVFQIGCFGAAPGGLAHGEETPIFTWFEGYAWQALLCRKCLTLLGWSFRSEKHQFFGLIRDQLIEDPGGQESSTDEAK